MSNLKPNLQERANVIEKYFDSTNHEKQFTEKETKQFSTEFAKIEKAFSNDNIIDLENEDDSYDISKEKYLQIINLFAQFKEEINDPDNLKTTRDEKKTLVNQFLIEKEELILDKLFGKSKDISGKISKVLKAVTMGLAASSNIIPVANALVFPENHPKWSDPRLTNEDKCRIVETALSVKTEMTKEGYVPNPIDYTPITSTENALGSHRITEGIKVNSRRSEDMSLNDIIKHEAIHATQAPFTMCELYLLLKSQTKIGEVIFNIKEDIDKLKNTYIKEVFNDLTKTMKNNSQGIEVLKTMKDHLFSYYPIEKIMEEIQTYSIANFNLQQFTEMDLKKYFEKKNADFFLKVQKAYANKILNHFEGEVSEEDIQPTLNSIIELVMQKYQIIIDQAKTGAITEEEYINKYCNNDLNTANNQKNQAQQWEF